MRTFWGREDFVVRVGDLSEGSDLSFRLGLELDLGQGRGRAKGLGVCWDGQG